jgi:hypothetical protein
MGVFDEDEDETAAAAAAPAAAAAAVSLAEPSKVRGWLQILRSCMIRVLSCETVSTDAVAVSEESRRLYQLAWRGASGHGTSVSYLRGSPTTSLIRRSIK